MARLINPGRAPLALPTGHVAPRGGELVTTNDVLRCPDNARVLSGPILSGQVTVEYDPDPPVDPETPSASGQPVVAADPPAPAPDQPAAQDAPGDTPSDTPAKGKAKG